jgi:hypothetical protein
MTIIQRRGNSYKVLIENMNFPFVNEYERDDMLCVDLTYFSTNINMSDIVLVRENYSNPVMTYQDIVDELEYLYDSSIRWRSEERRNLLKKYYERVLSVFKNYRREEKLEKIINPIDCNSLILAC